MMQTDRTQQFTFQFPWRSQAQSGRSQQATPSAFGGLLDGTASAAPQDADAGASNGPARFLTAFASMWNPPAAVTQGTPATPQQNAGTFLTPVRTAPAPKAEPVAQGPSKEVLRSQDAAFNQLIHLASIRLYSHLDGTNPTGTGYAGALMAAMKEPGGSVNFANRTKAQALEMIQTMPEYKEWFPKGYDYASNPYNTFRLT